MVQTITRCRECGLPGRLAEDVAWRAGGLVVLRSAHALRLAMVDESTIAGIKAALLGASGEGAVINGQRKAAELAAIALTRGLKGKLSRFGVARKELLDGLEDYSLLLGLGRIELEKHSPGEGGSMLLRKPFDLEIVAGAVTGMLERMDQCAYAGSLSRQGEDVFRLVLEAVERREADIQRRGHFNVQDRPAPAGDAAASCGKCGLPASLAAYRWDEVYGMIRAGAGGRRVSLLPHCMLSALEGRDGSAATGMGVMEDAVFRSVREDLQAGRGDAYESAEMFGSGRLSAIMRERMVNRGWGEPSFGAHGDAWSVEVLNPISDALIAGWLRAIYTVARGKEPRIEVGGSPRKRRFELG